MISEAQWKTIKIHQVKQWMGLQVCIDITKVLLPSPCPLTPHHFHLHSIMIPKENTLKPPQNPSPILQAKMVSFDRA